MIDEQRPSAEPSPPLSTPQARHPRVLVVRACLSLALIIATLSPAVRAETEYPPPARFVAAMELSIERCSARSPAQAARFAALREVFNGLFAQRNYAAWVGTPAYREAYAQIQAEFPPTEADLATLCPGLLRLHETPPQGAVYLQAGP